MARKRKVARRPKKSPQSAQILQPYEIRRLVKESIALSEKAGKKEEKSALEEFFEVSLRTYQKMIREQEKLLSTRKTLSDTRKLFIFFLFGFRSSSSRWVISPSKSDILKLARSIEVDLSSKSIIKANITLGRKPIADHVEASFDEFRFFDGINGLRTEDLAKQLKSARRLLVYAAYKTCLKISDENLWPKLSPKIAAAVDLKLRELDVELHSPPEEIFDRAVEAVRSRSK